MRYCGSEFEWDRGQENDRRCWLAYYPFSRSGRPQNPWVGMHHPDYSGVFLLYLTGKQERELCFGRLPHCTKRSG